ncbi:MAG: NADH-quinone oxidoreductase subunit M [Flavobacteriia bacterium]|nr:NADH-quinone oxidoreductase subunit M [Flavobacteriia bacterium]
MILLLIPSLFALLTLVVPRNVIRVFALVGGLASLIYSCTLLCGFNQDTTQVVTLFQLGQNSIGFSGKMGYDGIGIFMVMLTNVITLIILLSNYNREVSQNKLFTSMLFLMQAALLGVFISMDGLLFYIFWEISLIPIFIIALSFGESDRKAALTKFFIYTFVGSLAMLASLIAIKSYANSFAIEDLMAVELSAKTAFWVFGGFFLAFAIKIPLFPFHTWQPNTYSKAPMAGTMLLSALMLKMALYGMIRWMVPLAPEALNEFQFPIIVLGIFGVVYAGIIAIKQADMKRLFAFASISHVGLIAAGIILFDKDNITAALIQMFNHSLVAVGLFLAVDVIERRMGTRTLGELGGIAKLAPKFAFMFAALSLASVSVPFSSGFIGEFLLIKGLYSYSWVIGLIAGTTLVFGAVYTLRAYQLSMNGAPKITSFEDLSWNEWIAFFIIMAIIVVIGVCPQMIIDLVGPSIDQLLETYKTNSII